MANDSMDRRTFLKLGGMMAAAGAAILGVTAAGDLDHGFHWNLDEQVTPVRHDSQPEQL